MFPLTHIYVAKKTAGENPATLLGAILPDMSIVANGYLDIEEFENGMWMDKIKDPDLKSGLLSHLNVDNACHSGLAKLNVNEFPPKFNNFRRHILPEYFVELYVAKISPDVFDLFNYATSADITAISEDIAQATEKDANKIQDNIRKYAVLGHMLNSVTKGFALFARNHRKVKLLEECIGASKTFKISQ